MVTKLWAFSKKGCAENYLRSRSKKNCLSYYCNKVSYLILHIKHILLVLLSINYSCVTFLKFKYQEYQNIKIFLFTFCQLLFAKTAEPKRKATITYQTIIIYYKVKGKRGAKGNNDIKYSCRKAWHIRVKAFAVSNFIMHYIITMWYFSANINNLFLSQIVFRLRLRSFSIQFLHGVECGSVMEIYWLERVIAVFNLSRVLLDLWSHFSIIMF